MRVSVSVRVSAISIIFAECLAFTGAAGAQAQQAEPEASGAASAVDEKEQCIEAFMQAQRDQRAARLLAAQQRLLVCAQPTCGRSLMAECTKMYSDIERAVPSVVLSARDEAKDLDLTAVEVTLHGKPFLTSLDGLPTPIDPGEYEFTFSAPGYPPVKRRVVIGTGEKYRMVNVVLTDPTFLARPTRMASGLASPPAPVPVPVSTSEPTVPVMTWVLGGVGVVGLGAGAVLRVIGNNDFNAMKEGCGDVGCPSSDIKALEQKYTISNVAFGVGAAAAAGAVIWYLVDSPRAERHSVTILPAPVGSGAVATAQGSF